MKDEMHGRVTVRGWRDGWRYGEMNKKMLTKRKSLRTELIKREIR